MTLAGPRVGVMGVTGRAEGMLVMGVVGLRLFCEQTARKLSNIRKVVTRQSRRAKQAKSNALHDYASPDRPLEF
jgi:hypothetical protein